MTLLTRRKFLSSKYVWYFFIILDFITIRPSSFFVLSATYKRQTFDKLWFFELHSSNLVPVQSRHILSYFLPFLLTFTSSRAPRILGVTPRLKSILILCQLFHVVVKGSLLILAKLMNSRSEHYWNIRNAISFKL